MFEKNAAENYELNWIVNPANNVKFNKHSRLRDQLKQPSNCELLDVLTSKIRLIRRLLLY